MPRASSHSPPLTDNSAIARMSPPTSARCDTGANDQRGAPERQPFPGWAADGRLYRPVGELRHKQQAGPVDGSPTVDRAFTDGEKRGVFRTRERNRPGKHSRVPQHEPEDEHEDGAETDRAHERPEPVGAHHERERADDERRDRKRPQR